MNHTDWVLVTGAAHRLGREIALAFAAAGWDVLCHYRASLAGAEGTQAAVRALGRECLLVPADLAGHSRALFVVSTFGEGEAPDAARRFASAIARCDARFAGLQYAVLALGNRE